MDFHITDFGSAQLVGTHFATSGKNANDLMAPMARIGMDLLRIETDIFRSKGRRGGGSWKRLSPYTVKKKGHDTILDTSGALIDSLTVAGAQYQIMDLTRYGIGFGTDRPWSFVHQYGSRTVPRRPFLKFIPSDYARWQRWITEYILEAFSDSTVMQTIHLS